jgi:hypothetical protein
MASSEVAVDALSVAAPVLGGVDQAKTIVL